MLQYFINQNLNHILKQMYIYSIFDESQIILLF